MNKTTCFVHIYGVNHYADILKEYSDRGHDFFNSCDNVILLCAGCNISSFVGNTQTVVLSRPEEIDSMSYIWKYAKSHPDRKICYIHTKGVTKDNECITDWRRYMFYFCGEQYKDMIRRLDGCDTCGVDLRDTPVAHYSGNFWWANSNYISKLCAPQDTYSPLTERHKAEFWICSDKKAKHISIHDCGISVYERHLYRYPEERYKK